MGRHKNQACITIVACVWGLGSHSVVHICRLRNKANQLVEGKTSSQKEIIITVQAVNKQLECIL